MDEFDFIIVGAGSAGCVLADGLTANLAHSVLLLKAGGKDDSIFMKMPLGWRQIWRGPKCNWNFATQPEAHCDGRRLSLPRGKVLGGSSSINGMLYVRGNPRDYDLWRQAGCVGWSYADVLPYFKRAEGSWRGESEYHGGSGPLGVSPTDVTNLNFPLIRDTAANVGVPVTSDFSGSQPEGFGVVDLTIKNGSRASASRVCLKPAMKRSNLRVEIRALTHRIVFEQGRATGVVYLQGGSERQAKARREVVICGGSYNSPQLLVLSGVGPADELSQMGVKPVLDAPGVGKNLSEHVVFHVQYLMNALITFLNRLRGDRVAWSVLQWALWGKGDFATQALTALAFVRSRPDLERPDIQLFCNSVRMDAKIWFPGIGERQQHMLEGYPSLNCPESRGDVRLASADPRDSPLIRLNFLSTQGDRATARECIRWVRRFYNTKPLADLIARAAAEVGHHPVGTCAMGTGPLSVVDPQ